MPTFDLGKVVGPQGPQGVQGAQGIQGETGAQGPQGIQGETGPRGLQGIQGETGPKGDTGAQGPKGDTGATGPQGPKGDKGDSGADGRTPVKGTDYFTAAEIDSVATQAAGKVTPDGIGAAPTSRKVNGKALSSDITLSASDVGARANTWMPTAADVGALPATEDATYPGCYYTTNKDGNKEWINPPLANGVQYMTTERFFGVKVFAKSFEVTVSNGLEIEVSGAVRIIRIEGFVQSRGTAPTNLNNFSTADAYSFHLQGQAGKITVKCGSSVANKTAWITAYYTK